MPAARQDLFAEGRAIVEALGGRWWPEGGMCACPVHDDAHPSLSIRVGARSLLFKCFAGCETLDVIRAIRGQRLLARGRLPVLDRAPSSTTGRAWDLRRAAVRLWGAGRPIGGTPAECYLEGRGLAAPHPEARYCATTPFGRGPDVRFLPALLVAVRDASGLVAVQRTFLDPTTSMKRDMVDPRRTLGRPGAGAVRLAAAGDRLGLAEGYETARAAAALLGLPVWATLGNERLALVAVPSTVRTIVLLADPDAPGRAAQARARAAYAAQGFAVETLWPPVGSGDWSDVLARQEGRGRAGG